MVWKLLTVGPLTKVVRVEEEAVLSVGSLSEEPVISSDECRRCSTVAELD